MPLLRLVGATLLLSAMILVGLSILFSISGFSGENEAEPFGFIVFYAAPLFILGGLAAVVGWRVLQAARRR